MACTSLNLATGFFINNLPFTGATSGSAGPRSFNVAGNTVTVTGETGATPLFFGASQAAKCLFFGTDNHLAVLIHDTGIGPQTRSVSLIDFSQTPPLPVNVLTVLASGSGVSLPRVDFSQGNGNACIVFGTDGTNIVGFSILRSDNGQLLLAGPPPFVPDGDKAGEVTGTQLKITYNSSGTHVITGPKPQGTCQITPASQSFPDVKVGGCPVTPPTRDFTLKNTGDDCLTINSIQAASGPFALAATSVALPATLAKNQTLVATVRFQPASAGNFTNDLSATRTPAVGDDHLHCTGKGVAATKSITFNATSFNFGLVPVSGSSSKTLHIINNGSVPLNVTVVGSVAGTPFQWGPFGTTMTCGANQSIPITFVPPSEGPFSATLVVGDDAPGNPHNITLTGEGCVASASIDVPAPTPIDFAQVEQGFRTVRFFNVKNTGDGLLTFAAAISGPDAALFGLQEPSGSITNVSPNKSYTVEPVTPCGAGTSGSGTVAVAVAFVAGVAPKMCSATLTLSGSNATNVAASTTWTFPLTAEIVAPAAVDAGLIIDRSGSMNDPLGTSTKMTAAVAGAQLFVEMLRPDMDDRVNVTRFSDTADVVQGMVYVSSATTDATHERQSTIFGKVQTSVPPAAGNTAIAAGCMSSFDELAKPRATVPAVLHTAAVLLTDGLDNTAFEHPSGSGSWFSLKGDAGFLKPGGGLVDTSAIPFPPGVKFYAIGIGTGANVDKARLDQVTAATGGSFGVVGDLSGPLFYELEKRYLQILMELTGSSMITDPSFVIQAGQVHEFNFDLLRGDIGGTVVIFDHDGARLPFFLVAPNGEVVDVAAAPAGYQIRWGATHTSRFLELKVPALEPQRYAGMWKVVIRHDGRICRGDFNRQETTKPRPGFLPPRCTDEKGPIRYGLSIAAGSNFRLQAFVTPGPVFVGDPILLTGVVAEAGLPVLGCTVTVRAQAPGGMVWPTLKLYDDGAHTDTDKDDGEYANTFIHTGEAGTYTFTFRAEGHSHDAEPVVRELVRSKYVAPKYDGGGTGGGGTGGTGTGGGDDECCKKLLRSLEEQTAILKQIAAGRK